MGEVSTGQGPIAQLLQSHASYTDRETDWNSPKKDSVTLKNLPEPAKLANNQLQTRRSSLNIVQPSTKPNTSTLVAQTFKPDNWKLYRIYVQAISIRGIVMFILALISHKLFAAGSDIWVKVWLEATDSQNASYNDWFYLTVFLALGLGSAVWYGLQIYFLLAHCSLQVCLTLMSSTVIDT
jgi:hypothetical protein